MILKGPAYLLVSSVSNVEQKYQIKTKTYVLLKLKKQKNKTE